MAVIICYLMGIVSGIAIMKLIGLVREKRENDARMRMLNGLDATIRKAHGMLEEAMKQQASEQSRLPSPVFLPKTDLKNYRFHDEAPPDLGPALGRMRPRTKHGMLALARTYSPEKRLKR